MDQLLMFQWWGPTLCLVTRPKKLDCTPAHHCLLNVVLKLKTCKCQSSIQLCLHLNTKSNSDILLWFWYCKFQKPQIIICYICCYDFFSSLYSFIYFYWCFKGWNFQSTQWEPESETTVLPSLVQFKQKEKKSFLPLSLVHFSLCESSNLTKMQTK